MSKLIDTLRSLGVPVSAIADIDVLNDEGTFKNILETLGGDWEDVSVSWKAVSDAVLQQRPPLNAQEVVDLIKEQLNEVQGRSAFPKDKEKKIKDIFRNISPWGAMKRSGRDALPSGEPVKHFDLLCERCAEHGLWIVPVGEIEGFCRSIGSHGPGFVEKVLEERDLGADPELKGARDFIMEIWAKAKLP